MRKISSIIATAADGFRFLFVLVFHFLIFVPSERRLRRNADSAGTQAPFLRGTQVPRERRHPCLQRKTSRSSFRHATDFKLCRLGACVPVQFALCRLGACVPAQFALCGLGACVPLQIASTPFSLNSVSSTPMPIARLRRNASTTGTQAPLPAKHNLALITPATIYSKSCRLGACVLAQSALCRLVAWVSAQFVRKNSFQSASAIST